MIDFNEASSIAESEFRSLSFPEEEVYLLDSLNRILAEDVMCDTPLPPFNSAAMDGIAVKLSGGISRWEIIGEITAGNFKDHELTSQTCVYITTGSKVPDSADTVIPSEDLTIHQNLAVLNKGTELTSGQNIRKCGEYLAKNSLVVGKRTLIKQRHIAAAAACGKSKLKVLKKTKAGVLATGDEIVDVNTVPEGDKIRGSNLYGILSAVRDLGMEQVNLGILKDNREEVKEALLNALNSDLDIIITSGGVSAGKYDFIDEIFSETGVEIKFAGVNIKPGKPTVFGSYSGGGKKKLVIGLPGNPVSCLVGFILFVQIPFGKLFKNKDIITNTALLESNISKTDGKRHFLRGIVNRKNGALYVRPDGVQSSGDLFGMSSANCLLIIEENRIDPGKGEYVQCIMM